MKLAQLQEIFQAHVLQADPGIARHIHSDARFPAQLRLGVYADAYTLRLVEVLAESYPAVQMALGAKRFASLVSRFVKQHPSRFRSARAYGEQLPQWLGAQLQGPQGTGMADLARFEWDVAGAFDAADAPALEPARLAAVAPADWPGLRFQFSPSLRRLCVSSNCVAWWRFACAGAARPTRWRASCPQQWLVWRSDLAVYYRRLSQSETRVLDAALAGQSFGELCEQLESPAQAASLLHGWLGEGLMSAVAVRVATGT
jgi:hypothetical protein